VAERVESDPVTALILAGGKATRFGGIAKHQLVVEGRTIFARQVEVLARRVTEIIVSSPVAIAGYRTVADTVADGGPLAGIAAGLDAITTPWLLVVAGDMPYLSGAVIDLVLARRGDDGVGIEIDGLPQPLVCALRCEAAKPALARMLATGQRKASRLLTDAGLAIRWLAESDLRGIDPTLRALGNVNAPGDLPR
jgi:molybdopterin-guanine dinucleotide biosynthesis protein A